MFIRLLVFGFLLTAPTVAQEVTWQQEVAAANQALALRDYPRAIERFEQALLTTESIGKAQALRGLGIVARLQGKLDAAANYLMSSMGPTVAISGDSSLNTADLLSELAVVLRASGKRDVAMTTLMSAIQIRDKHAISSEALARDLTILGMLQASAEDSRAAATLERALEVWDSAVAPDDMRILVVLDTLGGVYRNDSRYAAAEPFYRRALAIRETVAGLGSADLIATLD